jgi:hypothetical protein
MGLAGMLDPDRGIKVREVWVQHLEESVTSGQVSISFFPLGWAEMAIVEVADGDGNAFSVLVYGLTGRVRAARREGLSPRGPHDAQRRGRERGGAMSRLSIRRVRGFTLGRGH